MSKLEDFGGDEAVAAEYSDVKECPLSDVGYHCSCYDRGGTFGHECCICEQKRNYPKCLNCADEGCVLCEEGR